MMKNTFKIYSAFVVIFFLASCSTPNDGYMHYMKIVNNLDMYTIKRETGQVYINNVPWVIDAKVKVFYEPVVQFDENQVYGATGTIIGYNSYLTLEPRTLYIDYKYPSSSCTYKLALKKVTEFINEFREIAKEYNTYQSIGANHMFKSIVRYTADTEEEVKQFFVKQVTSYERLQHLQYARKVEELIHKNHSLSVYSELKSKCNL